MTNTPQSKKKSRPRFGKLDGKPPSRPRGRHAGSSTAARETVTLAPTQRLGFRVAEFAALTGVSVPTIWRGIKSGNIKTIDHCGFKIVPRAFAVEAGFITADDKAG